MALDVERNRRGLQLAVELLTAWRSGDPPIFAKSLFDAIDEDAEALAYALTNIASMTLDIMGEKSGYDIDGFIAQIGLRGVAGTPPRGSPGGGRGGGGST